MKLTIKTIERKTINTPNGQTPTATKVGDEEEWMAVLPPMTGCRARKIQGASWPFLLSIT